MGWGILGTAWKRATFVLVNRGCFAGVMANDPAAFEQTMICAYLT
jgi:hypothetical protein